MAGSLALPFRICAGDGGACIVQKTKARCRRPTGSDVFGGSGNVSRGPPHSRRQSLGWSRVGPDREPPKPPVFMWGNQKKKSVYISKKNNS